MVRVKFVRIGGFVVTATQGLPSQWLNRNCGFQAELWPVKHIFVYCLGPNPVGGNMVALLDFDSF
jgi:hypothetical protein